MAANTQERLRNILEIIHTYLAENLEAKTEDFKHYEAYACLPEDYDEDLGDGGGRSEDEYIAQLAIQYPELHDRMRDLVRLITEFNTRSSTLWCDEEEHAGGCIARELALKYKEDVPLYARFLSSNDLNHEVNQAEDMEAVMEAWGCCRETYGIVCARWFTPGQHRDSFPLEEVAEAVKDPEQADLFLEMMAVWFLEEWFPPYTAEACEEDIEELFDAVFPEAGEETTAEMARRFVEAVSSGESPTLDELTREID